MSKVIRISDDLYDSAKEIAIKESRPISWQINIWAESGKNEKESFYWTVRLFVDGNGKYKNRDGGSLDF